MTRYGIAGLIGLLLLVACAPMDKMEAELDFLLGGQNVQSSDVFK